MNNDYASSGAAPTSTGNKILIALGVLSVLGVLAYLFVRNKATTITPITPEQAAASSASITNLNGAIDAEDEAVVQNMVNVVGTSPMKDTLPYMASIFKNFMEGGKDTRHGEYESLPINGQLITPKSSAFVSAFWSSVLPLYTTNGQVKGAPAVSGKTQEEADAAYNVGQQLAKMWEDYKYSKQRAIF